MYTNLVQLFKDAQQAAAQAYRAVAAAETEAFEDARLEHYVAMQIRSDYVTENELKGFCQRLVSRLVVEASQQFAPAGGKLDINQAHEADLFGLNVDADLTDGRLPDLDGFWRHLETRFSGDAGREVAFAQAAKAIIDGFWLRPSTEIKRTSSAVVLEKRVSSEISFRTNGRREVTYSSQTHVANTRQGLGTFAGKHGFSPLAHHLKHFYVSNLQFETREKCSFPGLDIVMFNDKWQFKFSHQVGDALSLFISEYGAEYLASRDRY
jgi:hypothetical protein